MLSVVYYLGIMRVEEVWQVLIIWIYTIFSSDLTENTMSFDLKDQQTAALQVNTAFFWIL
jgi:hypothetical protein